MADFARDTPRRTRRRVANCVNNNCVYILKQNKKVGDVSEKQAASRRLKIITSSWAYHRLRFQTSTYYIIIHIVLLREKRGVAQMSKTIGLLGHDSYTSWSSKWLNESYAPRGEHPDTVIQWIIPSSLE